MAAELWLASSSGWHSHSPAWSLGPLLLQFTFHPTSHPLCPCGCFAWHKAPRQVQVCGNPAQRAVSVVRNCPALPLLLLCLQVQPKATAVSLCSSALLSSTGSPKCRAGSVWTGAALVAFMELQALWLGTAGCKNPFYEESWCCSQNGFEHHLNL